MSKTKTIYLIRHGETDWNREKRIQGQSDIPLNDLGREQAKVLIPVLSRLKIQDVYSSDLSRAYETAQIATSEQPQLRVKKDIRFREAHLGDAEGLSFDDIILNYGEDKLLRWRSYDELDLDFKFPNGESKRQVMCRVRDALLDIAQTITETDVAIFCHGIVMRAVTHAFHQGAPWDMSIFSNGSVHRFEWVENRPHHLKYYGKVES